RVPNHLIGKWVIEGGEQDGATLDFFRDGTMLGRLNVQGREALVKARVLVEGNKLFITTQNPNTRADETRVQIIRTLTREALVLEDERGKSFTLKRASDL